MMRTLPSHRLFLGRLASVQWAFVSAFGYLLGPTSLIFAS